MTAARRGQDRARRRRYAACLSTAPDESCRKSWSKGYDDWTDRPALRRRVGGRARVDGRRAPPDRRAALLDPHRAGGRAAARRAAGGGVARGRVRVLHRPGGAEAAQPRPRPAGRGDDRQHRRRRLEPGQGRRGRGHGGPRHRRRRAAGTGPGVVCQYGDDWRFEVRGQEFVEVSSSGGSTEGGAWVYRVAPEKVLVFGDEHGQTRFRF